MREREAGIQRQRPLEESPGNLVVPSQVVRPKKVVPPLQVELVGLGIRRRCPRQPLPLRDAEHRPHRLDDPLRHIALDDERVVELPVILFGPQLPVGPGIDQLHVHPQPLAHGLHTPFHDTSHAQLPGDLPEGRDVRARVLHDGSATDDLDGTHPRELIEDLVLQPAGEVLPPTVGAQVFEGQHGDGRAVEWRLGRAQ